MKSTDILIIGGSATGVTAAISARRYYPDLHITLVRKEKHVLIPCGIPYIIGTIKSPYENLIPDAVLSKNNVEYIIDEVISIDKTAKTVKTSSGSNLTYKKLIIATGSLPFVPPIQGVDLVNVFTVKKNIEDILKLVSALDQAKNVVIVGGGFIGIEFADECIKRGVVNVTIIELLTHCLLLACDEEICHRVENMLKERGTNVLTNKKVKAIGGKKNVEYVELETGEKIKADMVILGLGATPNIQLATNAGLITDRKKGIYVDEFMRTTDENIFAAGDCTQKRCFFTGRSMLVRLASIGTTEARIASANLFNLRLKNECPIGVFGTVIGDLAVGSAGMTERAAKKAGFSVFTGEFEAPDKHPASMPNTKKLAVKLVFEKNTHVLLGGQVYGGMTAGKIANFIGALIQKKMRVDEIVTFQVGSHPMLTPSPIANQIANAAEIALTKVW